MDEQEATSDAARVKTPTEETSNLRMRNARFIGSDAKDRSVILLLQGTFETKENNQRVLTPTGLLLFYVADTKSPDVFKLPPGQF